MNETVNDVQILNSQFIDNKGAGVLATLAPSNVGSSFITNVTIRGNVITGNGTPGSEGTFQPTDGITLLHTSGHHITGNTVKQNVNDGIGIRNSSNTSVVDGNTVTANGLYGIHLDDQSTGNTVSKDTVCGNGQGQVFDAVGTNALSNNTVNDVCPP